MNCSEVEYAICRGQDIQTLQLKNKLKKELTIADDKNILKYFYCDMNAIYFWSDIKKNDIGPTRGEWMIMRKCSLTGLG